MTVPTTPRLSNDRLCAQWLLICCGMVFIMAIIGAITRLTESGLSITYWKPITGVIPPLSEAQWLKELEIYRSSPEYIQKNAGMSLGDFQYIYFWEWLHRLWGRLIGLVFAIPLIVFALQKRVAEGYGLKFMGLLALGGLQGFIGWWMVKSGLINEPAVSHYRLATHLGMALLLFGLMFWMALSLLRRDGALVMPPINATFCLRRHGWIAFAFLCLTIVYGAFVAGLDAGLIYNEWPLMGGHFVPSEMGALQPFWLNILENHAAVQFTHRWIAMTTVILVVSFAYRMKSIWLTAAVIAQFMLGVTTLLSHVWVPLGALHQAGAIILLSVLLWQLHRLHFGQAPQHQQA